MVNNVVNDADIWHALVSGECDFILLYFCFRFNVIKYTYALFVIKYRGNKKCRDKRIDL